MSVRLKRYAEKSCFALEIKGSQDEYGLAEHIFIFDASLDARSSEVDLCSIKGILIECEYVDLCIKIANAKAEIVNVGSFGVYHAAEADIVSARDPAIRLRVQGGSILFLYDPVVNDLDDGKMPGTRLIASLRKHFTGRNLQVVLDLGTPDDDPSFRDYFFSELDLLDLNFSDHRLAFGSWGKPSNSNEKMHTFTVVYE